MMKIGRFICAVFFLVFYSANLSHAQESVLEQIREGGRESLALNQIYMDFISVYEKLVSTDNDIDAFRTGDISRSFLDERVAKVVVQAQSEQAALKQRVKTLPPITVSADLPGGMRERLVRIRAELLKMPDLIDEQLSLTKTLYVAAINNDEQTYYRESSKSYRFTARLLRSESGMAAASLATIKSSHPQHSYFKSIIASNDALTVLHEFFADLLEGPIPDIALTSQELRIHAAKQRRAIEGGRVTAQNWLDRIQSERRRNQGNESTLGPLTTAFNTYEETFLVESEIANAIDEIAGAIAGYESFSVSENNDEMLTRMNNLLGIEIPVFVRSRLRLQNERERQLTLIGK